MEKEETENKRSRIINYYDALGTNLAISFLTSTIGGILSAILISIVLGQSPLPIYREFGLALILWGFLFLTIVIIFLILFWMIFVFFPRRNELRRLDKG